MTRFLLKRKLFFLFILLFGFCGVLGAYNLTPAFVFASSPSASVWDGNLENVNASDWFEENNECFIYSAKGLAYFANSVNNERKTYAGKTIYLETDIDWNNKSWQSIGTDATAFNGHFNGRGFDGKTHWIYNVNITDASANYVGFFGFLGTNAKVENLHLKNLYINTSGIDFASENENIYIGGLVAYRTGVAENCFISNCSVEGEIIANSVENKKIHVGGILGGSVAIISNCFSNLKMSVTGSDANVGGLVGFASNINVSSSFSKSAITLSSTSNCNVNAGGLVGVLSGNACALENVYNVGNINSLELKTAEHIGGLVGNVVSGNLTINHAYNAGDIAYRGAEGNHYAGLVGQCVGNATLSNAFVVGNLEMSQEISANTDFLFNGKIRTQNNLFSYQHSSNVKNVVSNLKTLAKTRGFYQNKTYFSQDWNFQSVWSISASLNNGLPYIKNAVVSNDENDSFDKTQTIQLRGNGTAKTPFLIETAGDLAYLSTLSTFAYLDQDGMEKPYYFSLENDIDLSGKTWVPIGRVDQSFNGVFDGNNFKISGLSCSLQEEFQFHGLFAQTGNAVIKNLIVEDFKFLEGEVNTVGTMVGNVSGSTYIINCKNLCNQSTVGNVSGGMLYVGFGKNNLNESGEFENDLNLEVEHFVAYDVTISGEGGAFYNTLNKLNLHFSDDDVYFAEYHVLLAEDGSLISTLDETFGKGSEENALPQNSSEVGNADVLINRGNRLKGFTYSDGTSLMQHSDEIDNLTKAVIGLKAVWEETNVTIRVVYNQYEISNFEANSENGFAYGRVVLDGKISNYTISLGGTDGKQVFVDFVLPYDAYLSEIPFIFSTLKYYDYYGAEKFLRDSNFEIETLFAKFADNNFAGEEIVESTEYILNDKFISSTDMIDQNTCTLYAKWKGKTENENKNVATIKFVTEDQNIDLTKVVNEVSMSGNILTTSQSGSQQVSTTTFLPVADIQTASVCTYDFQFDSVYSASLDEYISFSASVVDGFEMKGNPTITRNNSFVPINPNAGADSNFGVFTSNNSYHEYLSVDKLSSLSNIEFYNLVGTYTITITLQKAVYDDKLLVQGDVVLGISPLEEFEVRWDDAQNKFVSNVEIYTSSNEYEDILQVVSLSESEKQNLANQTTPNCYVGFDVKNNKILFSTENYDAKTYNFGDFFGFRFAVETSEGTIYKSYTIQKATYEDKKEIVLSEVRQNENNIQLLTLVLDKSDNFTNLRYTAQNSFAIIASTENEEFNFSECGYFTTNSPLVDKNSVRKTELKRNSENLADLESKALFEFENVVRKNETGDNSLELVLQYTQAVFDFEFEYAFEGQPADFVANCPSASFAEKQNVGQQIFDVSSANESDRQIQFFVKMTENYKLVSVTDEYGNQTIALKNGNNLHNIRIEVSNSNITPAEGQTKQEAQAIFENDFNTNNAKYFSSIRLEIGGMAGSSVERGTYKVSFVFNSNLSGANGLQPAHYTIKILCEDVKYSINYASKFLSNDDLQTLTSKFNNNKLSVLEYNLQNEFESALPINLLNIKYKSDSDFVDYITLPDQENYDKNYRNNAVEKMKINQDGNIAYQDVAVGSFKGQNILKYNDEIVFEIAQENQYAFYGLYVRGGNLKNIILASRIQNGRYAISLKNLYNAVQEAEIMGVENQVTVFALYVKKQFNLTFNNKASIENENGLQNETVANASLLGINFTMSDAQDQNIAQGNGVVDGAYSYSYSSSTNPSNIVVSLNGYNSAGYYFAGYKILDTSNRTIFVSKNFDVDVLAGTMNINFDWLKAEFEKDEGVVAGLFAQYYYLQPIIKQKSATIFFHSGTGNQQNIYGDRHNGSVFDNNKICTTTNVYQLSETLYFGNNKNLSQNLSLLLDQQTISENLFDLFATRTGYSSTGKYWAWRSGNNVGILSTSNILNLNYNFFVGSQENAQVHLYVVWTANSYTIKFDKNRNENLYFGSATGSASDALASYDQIVTLPQDVFELTGYDFAGWSVDENATEVVLATSLADIRSKGPGTYKIGNENEGFTYYAFNLTAQSEKAITLYAVWKAKQYKVQINYNSGSRDSEEVEEFQLTYNSSFKDLDLNTLGTQVSRKGFNFAGFYVSNIDGTQSVKVEEDTKLNTALLSATFAKYIDIVPTAVVLYATWTYDDEISLALKNNVIETTYSGQTQTYQISDFFGAENVLCNGLEVYVENNNLSFGNFSAKDVDFTTKFVDSNNNQIDHISLFDAGEFSFKFVLNIVDNSPYLQKGTLQTISINLYVSVAKAELDVVVSNSIKYINARKIMTPFVNLSQDINTFEKLISFVRDNDSDDLISYATDDEVYEYIIVKYYQLLHTSSGDDHKKFKQWSFEDFNNAKIEGEVDVNQIMQEMQFFTFYSLSQTSNKVVIEEYENHINFENNQVYGVSGDIVATNNGAKIVSATNSMPARFAYDLRIYLNTTTKIENYKVSQDNEGYYITVGKAYMLPRVLEVTNLPKVESAYFSSSYQEREVSFNLGETSQVVDGTTYFQVGNIDGNLLYANGTIFTSNAGKYDEDVAFTSKNDDNFLYFKNFNILLKNNDSFVDYTSNFKLVLSDENVFTIIKVSDVVSLEMTARYLTMVDGSQYCDEVGTQNFHLSDLQNIPTDLLKISAVYYDLGEGEKSVSCQEFPNQFTTDGGVKIYEIGTNNANKVSLILNTVVTKVEFLATKNIGQYISLYKWIKDSYSEYGVEGADFADTIYSLQLNKNDFSTEGLTTLYYNAIYTDLVKVKYNTNLPSDYVSYSNQSFIRLNHTTAENFPYPYEFGFSCANLLLENSDIDLMTQSGKDSFFTGVGKTYVGLNDSNRRATLTFSVLWSVEQISAVSKFANHRTAVSTFKELYVADVADVKNLNTQIFDYVYQWFKVVGDDFVLLSTSDFLTLAEHGSAKESGQYKLRISATIKSKFEKCLANENEKTSSVDVDFNLTFMPHKLQNITLPLDAQAIYNNQDHTKNWNVVLKYVSFNEALGENGEYNSEADEISLGYGSDGAITFEIFFNGDENTGVKVSEMKNAGEYFVYVRLQEGMFDVSNFSGSMFFKYVLSPYVLDLSTTNFDAEKAFNQQDPVLDKEIVLNDDVLNNHEKIVVSLIRNLGEDVGEYSIFLTENQNENYCFTWGEKTLWQNGSLQERQSVGTFTIKSSKGSLLLSFDGDKSIQQQYLTEGFSLALTPDLQLQIKSEQNVLHQFELQLFDTAVGEYVTNDEILSYLKQQYSALIPKFFISPNSFEKVENCATYFFAFEVGDGFAKYYDSVVLPQEYQFEILPIDIDISGIVFEKEFSGEENRTKEFDVPNWEGLKIVATFDSGHVNRGENGQIGNVGARLSLALSEGSNLNLVNFRCPTYVQGKITPLDATMTLQMTKEVYEYGEVSINNFSNLISIASVHANGEDVLRYLQAGYYSIQFSLAENVKTNASGFLFKNNEYVVSVNASFQDFNMSVSKLAFEVAHKEILAQIPENYISITTNDSFEGVYPRTQNLTDTTDSVLLNYVVLKDGNVVDSVVEGVYDLGLLNNEGVVSNKVVFNLGEFDTQGSIVIVVPQNNRGFRVVSVSDTLYVGFSSESGLTKIYDASTYAFEIDPVAKTFAISNGVQTDTISLTYFTFDEKGEKHEVVNVDFSQFEINSIIGTDVATSFKNAGRYYLNLNATANGFASVMFEKEHHFVINQILINCQNLNFNKSYDGNTDAKVSEFVEKIANEDVEVVGTYSNANVGNRSVGQLHLQGVDRMNYALSSDNAQGQITKALANITLKQTQFVYGEISQQDGVLNNVLKLKVEVISGSNKISESQYLLDVKIKNMTQEMFGELGYLNVGKYIVEISDVFENSNYEIENLETQITITKRIVSVDFKNDGEISIEYGTTLNGFEIPFMVSANSALSPLGEIISLTLLRNDDAIEINQYYKLVDGTYQSTDGNYDFVITDSSVRGAVLITASNSQVYALFENGETQLKLTYDGNTYDSVSLAEIDGQYQIVVSSSASGVSHNFALKFFTIKNGVLTPYLGEVQDLSTTLNFASTAKNVGTYGISADNTTSSTVKYVRMGKDGTRFAFTLQVLPKDLYFNSNATKDGKVLIRDNILIQTFNNKQASYLLEDDGLLLSGLVAGETVSLQVEFFENKAQNILAKYVGTKYEISASLVDEGNYVLHATSVPNGSAGVEILGEISKAKIKLKTNSQTFTYGEVGLDENGNFDFSNISAEFEAEGISLEEYFEEIKNLADQRLFDFSFNVVDATYSSSKMLNANVNGYNLTFRLSASDFEQGKFVIGSVESETLTSKVFVNKKHLQIVQKTLPLQQIFTKRYDANNNAQIKDERDNLLFDVQGIADSRDEVNFASASYSKTSGYPLEVTFVLAGKDSINYEVDSYNNGKIEDIKIGLLFDYKALPGVSSDVSDEISEIAFPFLFNGSVSDNASTNSTQNFPTKLVGNSGKEFTFWTIDFDNVSQTQLAFLEKQGLQIVQKGEGKFGVRVGNNAQTVSFLSALVSDEKDTFAKYYFQNHETINFVFSPNWATLKHVVKVQLADEKGIRNSELGSVDVEVNNLFESSFVETYRNQFDFASKVVLKVTPNEHCKFLGFYGSDGTKLESSSSAIIGQDGNKIVLTIGSIGQDYDLSVRFEVEKIDVVLDVAKDEIFNSPNFVLQRDGKYHWNVDYFTIQNETFSALPDIEKYGYDFSGFVVNNSVLVEKANFAQTLILTYAENLVVMLKPAFTSKEVVVTLEYGNNQTSKRIVANYGEQYSSAEGWEEIPERQTGKNFVAWLDENGKTVTGESVVKNLNAHTLTAKWEVAKYTIEFVSPNATISGTNIFTFSDGTYVASEIAYQQNVTFTLTAHKGYHISQEGWSEHFENVQIDLSGTSAQITFVVPDENFNFEFPVLPTQNTINIDGNRISQIVVYDVTDQKTEIEVINNSFSVATGRKLQIEVSAQLGYDMSKNIVVSDVSNIAYTTSVENGILTILIERIDGDVEIACATVESENKVTVNFSDVEGVDKIEFEGKTIEVSSSVQFKTLTGHPISFYVLYKFGYEFENIISDGFTVSSEILQTGTHAGYVCITVSNILSDGEIFVNSKLSKFTLKVEVVSYDDENGVVQIEENKAYVDGVLGQLEVDFKHEATLTYQKSGLYSFAGWKETIDGDVLSFDEMFKYVVENNQTLYAIFSTTQYDVSLAGLDYIRTFEEYGQDRVEETFVDLNDVQFYVNNQQTDKFTVFYGSSTIIKATIPNGYLYYGYGYFSGNDFVFIKDKQNISGSEVEISISSDDFRSVAIDQLYVVMISRSVTMDVSTKININGQLVAEVDVGSVALVSQSGQMTNEYGYVDGTRIHYANKVSEKAFSVVAYTNDTVYLKLSTTKTGYVVDNIVCLDETIKIEKVSQDQQMAIFAISNFVGGMENIQLTALFKPTINVINISFKSENVKVDGGAIEIVDTNSIKQVWTSGTDYASVSVSALTDSSFKVVAYVQAGFMGNELQVEDESGLIVANSLSYTAMSVEQTGFTGKITFIVAGYLQQNEINIVLKPMTYTVSIFDEKTELVKIKNVVFGQALNISQNNSHNIKILDDRIKFVNGHLNLILRKDNHHFEGYFTHQNGVGAQYINSSGLAVGVWRENGFEYDSVSNKYVPSGNTIIHDDGEIEISLYIYQSYLKTRIHFVIEPDTRNLTAKDLITGINHTNSWFYESNPNYIEVAFSTDVNITAPELDGYKFYKFVISQKLADGTWLSDVTSYSSKFPWSTNEFDNIVEVQVKVVYYAQVEVLYFGGKGHFEITQNGADRTEQSEKLIREGYVDTNSSFTITAFAEDGYIFKNWFNTQTGQIRNNPSILLSTGRKITLHMNLEGENVTLDFSKYDKTYGQIIKLESVVDGKKSEIVIVEDKANVKVGDKLFLHISVDKGFAVVWNRQDIVFETFEQKSNKYIFTMEVSPNDANQTVEIIPEFKSNIYSVFITKTFDEDLNGAVDNNNVNVAGFVEFAGQKVDSFNALVGQNIVMKFKTYPKYAIAKIMIENYGKPLEFEFINNEVVLKDQYLSENEIRGILNVSVVFERLYWGEENFDEFEGQGTIKNPYKIYDAEDLALVMKLCNSNAQNNSGIKFKDCSYILMNDINLSDKFWTPIGTNEVPFNGTFNFNGHKVSGIYTIKFHETISYNGLFGILGKNCIIFENVVSLWWVYLIVGLVGILATVLIIMILVNRSRKKQRDSMAKR